MTLVPKRVKKKSHEKLTDTNVQHVIDLLKDDDPITKKEACSILNISYNTTRLANIIDEYYERLDYKNKRKAENKGKSAREDEIKRVVEDYLDGDSIMEIASHIFRSPSFVKGIIDRVGVPQRASVEQMKKGTPVLPEACIAEEFEVGEVVWCPQYNAAAEVVKEHKETYYENTYECRAYQVYVIKTSEFDQVFGFYADQLAYDLGRLRHLEQYGIDVKSRMSK